MSSKPSTRSRTEAYGYSAPSTHNAGHQVSPVAASSQLQDELGVAYLFITHNFGVVEYLAHDIAVMKDGKIVESGTADEVLRHRNIHTPERC